MPEPARLHKCSPGDDASVHISCNEQQTDLHYTYFSFFQDSKFSKVLNKDLESVKSNIDGGYDQNLCVKASAEIL